MNTSSPFNRVTVTSVAPSNSQSPSDQRRRYVLADSSLESALGKPPAPPSWSRRGRDWEEALTEESSQLEDALAHAEKVEQFLIARIAGCEDAGRPVPERMLENLERMRARIEWLTRRIGEIEDDG